MRMRVVRGLAPFALALGLARGAAAQVQGIPVNNSGVPRGIGLYGDVGFPNTDAGKGTALAATARVGIGLIGASATVSTYNPQGPGGSITSVGGTANFRVFGGPLVPLSVTLQGGAGYVKAGGGGAYATDTKLWRFPIGLGIALSIPNPALAIKPWIAPRLDVTRSSLGGTSSTQTHFAVSGGVELNLLNGFGLQASYDWIKADALRPSTLALGAHYGIRVPGL